MTAKTSRMRMLPRFLFTFSRHGSSQNRSYSELENVIQYRFRNRKLLETAIAHRSYVHIQKQDSLESNERLEFLGDSVLNMVITDFLFTTHPSKQEGRLSKMKSLIVSSRVLSICAQNWDLGRYLLLSPSEAKSGGRQRQSILADAYEAVLGAVFLDGGIRAARKLVYSSLIPIVDQVLSDEDYMNYKSKLLEFSQAKGMGIPRYQVVAEQGPEHNKLFIVSVHLQNKEWGRGEGMSKKISEQAAARQAFQNFETEGHSL